MHDWSRYRYLVVEDSPTMRTWLRQSIINMGGRSVTEAATYGEALYHFTNREPFDVVLCDYVLSLDKYMTLPGGQKAISKDGQHLLEECRHRRLLPTASVFIMVTGESLYEKVFSVAELAPDDYVLKPLKPVMLAERLLKAILKKQALKGLFELFDVQQYEECLHAALGFLPSESPYAADCQRIIGECLLKLGRNEDAIRLYEEVLGKHPELTWAKMGLARARFHLDHYDETREILESLVAENSSFAQAHDLLARVHEVKGSPEKSRALIKEVLEKNPRAIHRHREVVRMALEVEDFEDASNAYESMFSHGAGSVTVNPTDFAGFSTLLLHKPGPESAKRLTQLITVMNDYHLKINSGTNSSGFQIAEVMAQFARAKATGQDKEAARFYQQLGELTQKEPLTDNAMRMSMLEIATVAGDKKTATAIAREVFADYHGNESMTRRILSTLERGGMGDEALDIRTASDKAVLNLNRHAITLAKSGKAKEAMEEFMRLADTTRNLSITFNAALAIVHWLESSTPDDALVRKLSHYIEVIQNRDPTNPRTRQLEEMASSFLRPQGKSADGSVLKEILL